MTAIVAIYDIPAVNLVSGDIVTDDPTFLTAHPKAKLRASVYVDALITGFYRVYFVEAVLLPGSSDYTPQISDYVYPNPVIAIPTTPDSPTPSIDDSLFLSLELLAGNLLL